MSTEDKSSLNGSASTLSLSAWPQNLDFHHIISTARVLSKFWFLVSILYALSYPWVLNSSISVIFSYYLLWWFLSSYPITHKLNGRKNLQLLRQKYYYATWKADGTRYMMLIARDGVYLIDRNFRFRRVQLRFPLKVPFTASVWFVLKFYLIEKDKGDWHTKVLLWCLLRNWCWEGFCRDKPETMPWPLRII